MDPAETLTARVGQTIAGRYVVERRLGEGGTSDVYAVSDLRLKRRVALKRGAFGARQAKATSLLESEFHTLSQLAHPTIIEVYDFGVDRSGAYYTMELLEGHDLHGQGPLPWREVCALLRDVASSLALLHARGLIHRDVSARNVRRTTDGRAKLIDFGAMTAFGVAKDVVGTPPFLAPEALQQLSLDGRADLYALGALGYYLLTGTHAYPVRRFRELRDAWRSRPMPVGRYQPEVPAALNELSLQLLSLDRAARPHSASEVMQRLCAIADLPMAEHALVSRAYLTTPALLGRDSALVTIRRHMLRLGRGHGSALLFEGEPGSGRSRLLDTCALEAKLVGACVLRAQSSAERAEWTAMRVLVRQLVQLQPEAAEASARLSRDVLGPIVDDDAEALAATATPAGRSPLLRALRNFFVSMSRVQRLVILVDDAERIDDASAALLASLSHKTRRHPVVIALAVARDADERASASLRYFRLSAERLNVEVLGAQDTDALLRSVFGEVPGLALAAGRIHALSHGNPAQILEFAQDLVDRGLARYEAGAWSLPTVLSARDLPESLAARLGARLVALSSDAREVCEVLCVADGDNEIASVAQFAALCSHGDPRRVVAALDELELARVLIADRERPRFSQRTFLTVVDAQMQSDRRHWLQARVADMLGQLGGDVLRRAAHLLDAGRELEALELIDPSRLQQQTLSLGLLERALGAAITNRLPLRRIHELRTLLVRGAAMDLATELYRQHAPSLLVELEQSSGLSRYRELDSVPESERLARALRDTGDAYRATPESERLLPLPESIRSLVAFCLVTRAMALATFDRELLEDSLPDLTPFSTLSPVIEAMEETARINRLSLRGRFQLATEGYERLLASTIEREKNGQLLPEYAHARYPLHFVLGMLDAGRGRSTAEAHAAALARERKYRVNAWRVRAVLKLAHGDSDEAAKCRRRAELAMLREGVSQQFAETTAFTELQCYVLCGDLAGVQQMNRSMQALCARYPGWRQFLALGRAHELRLRGDSSAALAILEPVLRQVTAGVHASYAGLAACHLQLLCDAKRVADAVRLAAGYLEACEREQLSPSGYVTHVAAAIVYEQSGQLDRAVETLERALALAQHAGHDGVCVGNIYEARARVALAQRDSGTFQRFARLCTAAYGEGKNPHLAAKLARLFEAGSMPERSRHYADAADTRGRDDSLDDLATLRSRMLECVDEGERARCALTILLTELASSSGYLYGVNDQVCVLLAKLPENDVDPDLGVWVEQLVAAEISAKEAATEDSSLTTDSVGTTNTDLVSFRYTDRGGRVFEPVFLIRNRAHEQRLAAVLVFDGTHSSGRRPSRGHQEDLADQLLTHSDVRGALIPSADVATRGR